MGADHRKPAVAFVVLALIAVALVGSQRAEAQHGRLLAAVIAVGGQAASIRGLLPDPPADAEQADRHHVAALGPMFPALPGSDERGATRETTPTSIDHTPALGATTDRGASDRTSPQVATTDRGATVRTSAQRVATTERVAGSGTGAAPWTRTRGRAAEVPDRARQGRRHGLATAAAARQGNGPRVAAGHPGGRGLGKKLGLIGEVPGKVPGHAGRRHDTLHGHAGRGPGNRRGR